MTDLNIADKNMVDKLRNIALAGHGSSGKTSLAEALLYKAGLINRMGSILEGNTAMDFEPEELKRQISINTAFHQYEWKKHTVNLIDTPGDQNFISDAKTSMQGADGVLVVVDGVDGVKVQTELVWEFAKEYGIPKAVFINKLDKERANFAKIAKDVAECFELKPLKLYFPIGSENNFNGIVDMIAQRAYIYAPDGKVKESAIPEDIKDEIESERESLIENIAEADDELLEKYLDGQAPTKEELLNALRKGVLSMKFIPILIGSAVKNIGIDILMDFINNTMPSPIDRGIIKGIDGTRKPDIKEPFSAFVFKTIADPYAGRLSVLKIISGSLGSDGSFYNINKGSRERFTQLLRLAGKEQKPVSGAVPGSIVAVAKLKETLTGDTLCDEKNKIQFEAAKPLHHLISFAVSAKEKGDEDKIFASLTKLQEEDTALKLERNSETKEILLSGMGQVHIEVIVEKLRRKFGVDVLLKPQKVPYKETIKKKVRVQGRHKKQSGGHGQFGDCWVQFEPLPRGSGFEFVDAIFGGSVPKQYIPAVEKGIIESSQKGVLTGSPCVDFRATLDDGSYHPVDSSEMAFKIAGSLAYKKALEQATPIILEPIMKIMVTVPEDCTGDIMGNLNSRRGRVLGMENKGKNQIIIAHVPMAEFLTYAPDLRSMTGGRGIFSMEFDHYEEVPAQIAQKVIDELNKNKQEK